MKISRMVNVDSDAEKRIKQTIMPICKGKVRVRVAFIVSDDDYERIKSEIQNNPTKIKERVLDDFTDLT